MPMNTRRPQKNRCWRIAAVASKCMLWRATYTKNTMLVLPALPVLSSVEGSEVEGKSFF